MSFLTELKRRKVVRVAAVYAATGFVVLQAADLVLPALMLPEWTYRLLVFLVLFGFPIALVLAWAFDLTPEGVVRTGRPSDAGDLPDRAEPLPALLGRRSALVTGAAISCYCGSPFDLDATPNLRRALREAGFDWAPPSPIRFPAKDW